MKTDGGKGDSCRSWGRQYRNNFDQINWNKDKYNKMDLYTTDTSTLIKSLRVLSRDIHSEDGVANAAIEEAANRMEKMQELLRRIYQFVEISKNCALTKNGPYGAEWLKNWLKEATDCIEDKKV